MPAAPEEETRPLAVAELDRIVASAFAGLSSVVLAVSGGADSLALIVLAEHARLSLGSAQQLLVATVDHRLRAEAAAEARVVAARAHEASLPHHILPWTAARPRSGLQAAARNARYRLLAGLVEDQRLPGPVAIMTGHHLDDQAETVLMRLARGSGVDGLAAMAPRRILSVDGKALHLLRPFLDMPKSRLVATVRARGWTWAEDPSNHDTGFERVRVRQAIATQNTHHLTPGALATTARRLMRARSALDVLTDSLFASIVDCHEGAYATLPCTGFDAAPEELRLRLINRLVAEFGAQDSQPRLTRLETLIERLAEGRPTTATLSGCQIRRTADRILVYREAGRKGFEEIVLGPGEQRVWDGRFEIRSLRDGLKIRALSPAAWRQLNAALTVHLPRSAALTLPAAWIGDQLVAVLHPAFDQHPALETCLAPATVSFRFIGRATPRLGLKA